MDRILELLNNQLNINLVEIQGKNLQSDALHIRSDFLRSSILGEVEGTVGSHVLKLSLPIDEYARYKNNSISSFIRKNGAISEHVGHQELKTADIVDAVFFRVSQFYTEKILQEFRSFFDHVQLAIRSTEQNIIGAINYNFDREYLNELGSITEFFEEIYEDIGDIAASKERCNSYLTHVVGNRQKSIKLINHFLNNLWSWPNRLLWRDQYDRNYISINYDELANDYLLCRQAISNYVVCLVFEHILSGNIDEKDRIKVTSKIQKNLQKFDAADAAIKNSLRERDANNWQNYYWYSPYDNNFRRNDRAGIDWFIRECSREEGFEVKEVNRLFDKSQALLGNIIIE